MKRCSKRRYKDRVAAELALATIRREDKTHRGEQEQRAYRCPHHPREVWHLTHIEVWKGSK